LFNSMSEGFCLIEMLYDEQGRANDYRYLEVNPAFKKQSGLQNVVGKRIREFAPNLEEFWFEKFGEVALTGEPVEIENEAKDLNRWFNVKAFKVGAQDNQQVGLLFTDITEHKQAEENLYLSEERFRMIYENVPALIDGFDENGRCILWNKECVKTFGWTMEELNAVENSLELFYPDPDVRAEVLSTVTNEPDAHFREWSPRTKDGRTLAVLWANFRLPDGMVFSMGIDITNQKKAEDSILKSLEEKETMLKEIHHRVKNNLQVIVSLLNLQASSETNEEVLDALRDSQQRISVMAKLHEALYQSGNLSSINIRDYLSDLINDLLKSLNIGGLEITNEINIDEINFDISQSIALGQIVSELISNSFKHAFVDRQSGDIKVTLNRIEDEQIMLTVTDDGKGFPKNYDIQSSKTLGLKLVKGLSQQLHGSLSIDGGSVKIQFPEKKI